MNGKRFGHIVLFDGFQKPRQRFKRRFAVVVATAARVGLLIYSACFYTGLREHEPEGMASSVSCLSDARRPWHMAFDTTPESVKAMSRTILNGCMAAFAKLVAEQFGFRGDDINQGR